MTGRDHEAGPFHRRADPGGEAAAQAASVQVTVSRSAVEGPLFHVKRVPQLNWGMAACD